jgi:hypothetical protein
MGVAILRVWCLCLRSGIPFFLSFSLSALLLALGCVSIDGRIRIELLASVDAARSFQVI